MGHGRDLQLRGSDAEDERRCPARHRLYGGEGAQLSPTVRFLGANPCTYFRLSEPGCRRCAPQVFSKPWEGL